MTKFEKDQERKNEIADAYRFGMEDGARKAKFTLEWVGLTDKERRKLYKCHTWMDYAKAIEQALKEKNT
jgi:hypothetical protein